MKEIAYQVKIRQIIDDKIASSKLIYFFVLPFINWGKISIEMCFEFSVVNIAPMKVIHKTPFRVKSSIVINPISKKFRSIICKNEKKTRESIKKAANRVHTFSINKNILFINVVNFLFYIFKIYINIRKNYLISIIYNVKNQSLFSSKR